RTVESQSVDAKDVAQTAQALDVEMTRVDQLVRRLIDYARPLAPQFQVCQPAQLLEAAIDASRRELTRAQANVRQIIEPGLPPLEVDPLLVTQALSNLICNAAQAMMSKGMVQVEVRRVTE